MWLSCLERQGGRTDYPKETSKFCSVPLFKMRTLG